MRRAGLILALALPLLAAKADPLAGRIAGAPVDCIDNERVDGPTIVDARTILYRQSGKRIRRTGPLDDCPALRPMTTMIVDIYGGHICRGDRFRVIEPMGMIPSGYCRFGAFVPYDRP